MRTALPIRRVPRWVIRLFFGFLLLLGAGLFSTYGTSWDEATDHRNGLVSLRYVAEWVAPGWAAAQGPLQRAPLLQGYQDNNHGVLFELPLALLGVLFPSDDPRAYYLLRHAAVYLVNVVGVWALFRLATLRFRDERLGLLAAGLLVLSPRLFADSFYNGKDMPFLALFTLGSYTLAWLLERPSGRRAAVHGLATAAAIDVRILGLLLVPFTLTLLALQLASAAPGTRRQLGRAGLAYLPVVAAGVVAGWPYLWEHPLANAATAFVGLSRFNWEGEVLYLGELLPGTALPWHYVLVWLSITTPLAYQLAALVGLGGVATALLRRPWATLRTPAGRLDLLLAGWLTLPLLLVMGLHSVLYDGWRHLYFVYPALLVLAVRGGVAIAQLGRRSPGWRRLVRGLGLVAGAEAVLTAGRMVAMHPHQQVYFSYLPRRVVEQQFERDYWGLSFRQGLEFLAAHQPKGPLLIKPSQGTLYDNNRVWLSPRDRDRLRLAYDAPGRYFITAYRFKPGAYPPGEGEEVFFIRADGVKILSIFQLPPTGAPRQPAAAW